MIAFAAGIRGFAQDGSIPSATTSEFTAEQASGTPLGDEPHRIAPSTDVTGGSAERVRYVGPDTYILLDAEGRPQAMPGMSYEDFLAAWKRLQRVEPPDRERWFAIERVAIVGTARENHADLQCDVTVRRLTDGPVDVPLGMKEAILQGEARFNAQSTNDNAADNNSAAERNQSSEYLDYDRQRGGFVARLDAESARGSTISFHLLVPLVRDAEGTSLSLTCPRAAASSLTLEIDAAVSEANVTSGLLTAKEATTSGTRLRVVGATGPLKLTWRTSEAEAGPFATVLNAQGAIQVAIDGRSVRTNARLTVQSYGGSFDRFRVQLPRGAQLIQERPGREPSANAEYRISLEQGAGNSDQSSIDDRRQIVLVELTEKQRGPATIDLATEQPIGLEADSTVELSGMEVLGAVRQFGDVVLQVAPDWQAHWEIGPHVRQVDLAEVDATLQQSSTTAAFQYDRQPWSLAVQVAPRRFRVLVTPDYQLDVSSDEARLKVHLTYQVLGARAFEFQVNLNGWELTSDPVESGGLVDNDRILVTADGVLQLPLAQALSRRAEIAFTAKRTLSREDRSFRLLLPLPIADVVSPADLVARASADVSLVPNLTRSSGLIPRTNVEPPAAFADDTLSEFSFRTTSAEATFAADRVPRSREVSHEVSASIELEDALARVEQRIDYDVQHVAIEELSFEMPEELSSEAVRVQVALLAGSNGLLSPGGVGSDGSTRELPLRLVPRSEERQGTTGKVSQEFRAVLPQPQLGKLSAVLRYDVARPIGTPSEAVWQVPFALPLDGQMTSQRVLCRAARRMSVSLDPAAVDSTWQPMSPQASANASSSVEFAAGSPQVQLPLIVHTVNVNTPAEAFVDRLWLQTWISDEVRQDRAAFRFRTAGSQVAVELAPQTPDALEVLIDGQRARLLSREPGRVVAAVPQPPQPSTNTDPATMNETMAHTLELRCRIPIRTALLTRHVLTPHQMVGSMALTEAYWQVVLPGDTHMVRSPRQMTAANVWQWLGSFWGRHPTRSQEELEAWTGASAQASPTQAQNQYLFTGLAPVSTMEFVTSPRWLIVLVASSCVLGTALAFIYVPAIRRRWMLVALACLLAGLALSFPMPALLLAQASALGLVFALLAVVIARLVARPSPWPVVVPASGTHREVTPRQESIVMPPVTSAASTAPTIPLRTSDFE